jgi:hypothetical protein
LKAGDLVTSKEILLEGGAMGSRSNLSVTRLFAGAAIVIELTKIGKMAKILTDSGEVVIVKIRHLEVINEMD